MKKTLLAAITAAIAVAFASCGSSSVNLEKPESGVKAATEMAQNAVPVEDNSIIGSLPSLEAQLFAAKDSLKRMYRTAEKGLSEDVKSVKDLEKARDKMELLGNACKVADNQLKDTYLEKLNALASELTGKEVAVEFDKEQYSAAKVVVKEVEVANSGVVNVNFQATLTPCASLGSSVDWVRWEYLTPDNEKASYGADALKQRATIGEPFTFEFTSRALKLQNVNRIVFIKTK